MTKVKKPKQIEKMTKAELVEFVTKIKKEHDAGLQFDENHPEEEGWLGDDDLFNFVHFMSDLLKGVKI